MRALNNETTEQGNGPENTNPKIRKKGQRFEKGREDGGTQRKLRTIYKA